MKLDSLLRGRRGERGRLMEGRRYVVVGREMEYEEKAKCAAGEIVARSALETLRRISPDRKT